MLLYRKEHLIHIHMNDMGLENHVGESVLTEYSFGCELFIYISLYVFSPTPGTNKSKAVIRTPISFKSMFTEKTSSSPSNTIQISVEQSPENLLKTHTQRFTQMWRVAYWPSAYYSTSLKHFPVSIKLIITLHTILLQ